MSGIDQLQYLSWLLYLLIFVAVLIRTIGRPTPAHIDMSLFFGAVVVVIVVSTLTAQLSLDHSSWLAKASTAVSSAALMSLGYWLLRLVHDFSDVPWLLMRAVEVGLIASVVAIIIVPTPVPDALAVLLVAYFVVVVGYDTWAFARHAKQTHGVTSRRMVAVAGGSLCLGLVLVVAAVGLALPAEAAVWAELAALLGLASGVCYFVGFAPPTWLRRAWQEPEVRAFLARAASLPRLPDTGSIVHELERGAASAIGAPAASIALWDPDTRRLEHAGAVATRAFVEQRASLVTDAASAHPDDAAAFALDNARSVLAAPITAGDKRLGALAVYSPRAPVFANSDLELVQLLADQAAVILESRSLIDQAARVRAREEAARLKDDFLSSAAHDLKTPLTGLVTQAQLLRRRAQRDPVAPVDRVGLDRLLEQSMRLKDLVLELLDVSRLEQGSLIGEREDTDLRALVQAAVGREMATWKRVRLEAGEPVVARVDGPRFEQVLTNLVENALKYSPNDAPVRVRVWREGHEARLDVRDQGIGIPIEDQPLVFERFHRAQNVDDRRFAGMGLGLYIARGIVEQHGGRIWVESVHGAGSTFHVALPAALRDEAAVVPDEASAAETAPAARLASA